VATVLKKIAMWKRL